MALKTGKYEIADYLILHGADVNKSASNGFDSINWSICKDEMHRELNRRFVRRVYFALRGIKILKNLLEKRNTCGIICVGYNCNALQFWSGRKLFGPP